MSKFFSVTRAWLRQTFRSAQEVDVSLSGPQFKLKFKIDEPLETRSGFDPLDKRPFYESDSTALYNYYYSYRNTPEYLDNVVYADILPLRIADLNGISLSAVCVEDLKVAIEPSSYRVPEKLSAHSERAIKLFKDMGKIRYFHDISEWENNISLRIDRIEPNGEIWCRKATYFDQVTSNLTLDWASGSLPNGWHTIRSGIERPEEGKLRPLRSSVLANTLGVATVLYNRDLAPIFRVRSDSLASIPKCGLHCTASGVHEVDPSQPPGIFDFSILRSGMVKEIKHEIGLDEHEYHLFPVVFARELPRGGKPQLFFVAIARVEDHRIHQAMASADEGYEYIHNPSATHLPINSDIQTSSSFFTYEGWACLRFAERFIEANQAHLSQLVSQEKEI